MSEYRRFSIWTALGVYIYDELVGTVPKYDNIAIFTLHAAFDDTWGTLLIRIERARCERREG